MDKCDHCGKQKIVHCNVCGEDYTCSLKDHQKSTEHKSFKKLFYALQKLSQGEKQLLFKKYVTTEDPKEIKKQNAKILKKLKSL